MPLTKLFQKRHSLKETSLAQETNKELEKLKSSFSKIETIKSQSESNLTASNYGVDTTTPISSSESQSFSPAAEGEDMLSKYEYLEKACEDSSVQDKTFSNRMRRESAPAQSPNRVEIKTIKSASCSEQQSTSKTSITRRRKCASESQADDFESSEKDKSRRLELDDAKLEDMIGRCLNRIIKESILTAVKNVNVDGIYEEIIENISSQRQDSIHDLPNNEGKCFSDVAEFVELDESSLNYRAEELGDEDESKESVSYTEDKKIETNSLGGYSADFEESMSLHSTDIEFKEQLSAKDSFSDATIIKEKNILTEKISQTSEASNEEGAEGINNDEESSLLNDSIDVTEHLASAEPDSKKNLTHDAAIEDYSLRNNCESSFAENSKNAEDHQIEIQSDATDDLKDNKCEKINSTLDEDSSMMAISDDVVTLPKSALSHRDSNDSVLDSDCFVQTTIIEEKNTNNWKMGCLHVKLPQKERGKKAHLKAWKKRCVSIQTDEFVNDPKNPCLMLSLYSAESGTARKRGATFWKSISCNKAAIFRSSSRSHKYAFTITDDNSVIIHLAADSETSSQEWMAAIRSILWPPSPVVQLEKMLYGKEYEISIVDNDFSFRAGLLGMYGYLTITEKKLILVHPQQGYVIQEWYLNTIDKFELMPQSKIEDAHKVLSMTTCSDSSTGKGEILMYCPEAVAVLQSIASTIHEILTVHIEQKGGKYDKELAEIADWLVPSKEGEGPEDYYKVPPRQVKSLLDIPNFIFDKPITPSTTVTCCPNESMESRSLETAKTNITRASQDSGISAGNISEDMLNCSSSSFLVGGGQFPGKSSDSELSDSYTPPRSPLVQKKVASPSTLQIP